MNVYVVQTALRMARRGIAVEIFTRATSSEHPPVVELAPGVLVRHVVAGPFEGLGKNDLPSQLCAFTAGVLRAEARHEPGWYDVVHSHYWLSGQVGWLARDRWGVPLVHTAHTLARVKNAALAAGRPAGTDGAGDRRGPGRRRGGPPRVQHPDRGRRAGRPLPRGPGPDRHHPARRGPRPLPPR